MNTNNTIGMPCDDMSREELVAVVQNLLRSNTRLRDERMSLIVSKRGLKICYDNLSEQYKELEEENVKLRKQVENLTHEYDCLMNENIKLRELPDCAKCARGLESYIDSIVDPLKAENAKLRELIYER